MKPAVIINPISGRGLDARTKRDLAWRVVKANAGNGEVFLTERKGHGGELARDAVAQGFSPIIAWGGDGTVNEIVPFLMNQAAALGIVPGGSGNGLARELRIDRRPERALAAAITGGDRQIDVGEMGGRMFVNVAGIGFDAHVAYAFNSRAIRGPRGYFTTTMWELFTYAAAEYEICLDQETMCHRAMVVALANSRQYGTGACIAANARIDDGLLDLVIVNERNLAASFWDATRLFSATLHLAPGVLTRKVREVTISSKQQIPFHVDGEVILGPSSLKATVHPASLTVRT